MKLQKVCLIVCVVLLSTVRIYAQNYRNMAIFLDWDKETSKMLLDSGSGWGPNSKSLVYTLFAQSSIAVASAVTWKNVIVRRALFEDFKNLTVDSLLETYKTDTLFSSKEKVKEFKDIVKNYQVGSKGLEDLWKTVKDDQKDAYQKKIYTVHSWFLCSLIDVDQWIFKKVNNGFYCFIPKKYLNSVKKEFLRIQISDDEALGIKFSNLDNASFIAKDVVIPESINWGDTFNQAFESLFYTKEESKKFIPEWFFYVSGHGGDQQRGDQQTIAALKHDQFRRFLDFCNNKIYTRFLFYTTCFGGGKHLIEPYTFEENKPPLPYVYNFYIGAGTLVFAPTFALFTNLLWPKVTQEDINKIQNEALGSSINLIDFFDLLKKYFSGTDKKLSLSTIIDTVNPLKIKESDYDIKHQVSVIRFPYTQWFALVDVAQRIERLTRTKIELAEAEDKLLIIKNKEVVVVDIERPMQLLQRPQGKYYDAGILTTLKIVNDNSSAKPPVFIINDPLSDAMQQKYVRYYFDKIDASQFEASDVIKSFFPQKELPINILMGELAVKNDLYGKLGNTNILYFTNVYIEEKTEFTMERGMLTGYVLHFSLNSRHFTTFLNKTMHPYVDVQTPEQFKELFFKNLKEINSSQAVNIVADVREKLKKEHEERIESLRQLSKILGKKFEEIQKLPQQTEQRIKEVIKQEEVEEQAPQDPIADALNQFADSLGKLASQVQST